MPIEPIETNTFQRSILARAHAVTREQLDLAKDLVAASLGGAGPEAHRQLVAQVAQALSANYLAEMINAKQLK